MTWKPKFNLNKTTVSEYATRAANRAKCLLVKIYDLLGTAADHFLDEEYVNKTINFTLDPEVSATHKNTPKYNLSNPTWNYDYGILGTTFMVGGAMLGIANHSPRAIIGAFVIIVIGGVLFIFRDKNSKISEGWNEVATAKQNNDRRHAKNFVK